MQVSVSVVSALWALSVTATGTSSCPTLLDVNDALLKLHGNVDDLQGELRIAADATSMRVEVIGPDGSALANKTFPGKQSCSERAQVAAVFASTWQAAAAVTSALADVQVQAAPPKEAAQLKQPVATLAVAPTPPALRVGIAGFGLSDTQFQDSPSLGMAGELAYRPTPRWGARAEVFGIFPRSLAVGGGEASLQRVGIGAGVLARWPAGWGAVVGDVDLLVARTTVRGSGFSMNTEAQAWVPGLRLGIGADFTLWGPIHAACEAVLLGWTRSERLIAQGAEASNRVLPRVDALLRLTLAWEKNI